MPRFAVSRALVLAALLVYPATAGADMAAPPAPLQRAAAAEVVMIGKVVSIEDKTITAKRYPGDTDKGEYNIAVVKIETGVVGAKGLTHIRVGFIPAGDPNVPRRRPLPVQLNKDDEVILFLQPHFDANFHIAPYYYDGIIKGKDEKGYEKVSAEVKRAGKLLNDPLAGLTSKDASERFQTAALQVARHRAQRLYAGKFKLEAIDAKESKLILEALAEADWGKGEFRFDMMTPAMVFGQLGLSEKDGWKPPQDYAKFPDAAKKWLKENADKYRVQKIVYEKADK